MVVEGVHELLGSQLEVYPLVDIDVPIVCREGKILHLIVHDHIGDVVLQCG